MSRPEQCARSRRILAEAVRRARVHCKHRLRPHRLDRCMASNDSDFENKAADIIGPYLNPLARRGNEKVTERS